jgi:hypothetical protein
MSEERRDSEPREDEPQQDNEVNVEVETGNATDGGPVDSTSGGQEDDFGAIAPNNTSSTMGKSEEDAAGYFGLRHKRLLTYTCLLIWFCIFVFPRWSEYQKAPNKEWRDSFKLEVGGAVIIFLSLFVMLVLVFLETRDLCNYRLFKLIFTLALAFGGFLYWVGGIQFAKSVNDQGMKEDKSHRYHLQGWAGAVFVESTFVFLYCLTLGLDYLTNFMSKSERIRAYLVWNTVLAFCALVGAFSYAAWRGYTTYYPIKITPGKTRCVAAGWFLIFFSCVYFYVVEFVDKCCKCSASAQRIARERSASVKLAGCIILLFGGFLVMAGMWAIGSIGDKKWNCYYAGYGFFILFFTLVMALDFHLGRALRK